jgi:hypothetical protein
MDRAVVYAKEDLYYFVRYLLWEECVRMRPAKRRRPPKFDSFWLERKGKLPLRDTDVRERSYACIEALVKIGRYSIAKAAEEVAAVPGQKTSSARDSRSLLRGPRSLQRSYLATFNVVHAFPFLERLGVLF